MPGMERLRHLYRHAGGVCAETRERSRMFEREEGSGHGDVSHKNPNYPMPIHFSCIREASVQVLSRPERVSP